MNNLNSKPEPRVVEGDASNETDESESQGSEQSSSLGSGPRVPQSVSTYHIIMFLDRLLKKDDDTRQGRLQKVSAFLVCSMFCIVLTLFMLVGAAAGTAYISASGTSFAIVLVLVFLAVLFVLVRTKSARWAYLNGHVISFLLSVLSPIFVITTIGVGLVTEDGEPLPYQFIYFTPTPAIVAFLLRSRGPVFAYAAVLLALMIGGTVWNPRGDDLTGVLPALFMVIMSFVIVTFCLGMFMDVAEVLHVESESATARTKVAEHEARTERQANKAKTRFVSVMSHEIRNPLQAILLQLEMLELTKLNKAQRHYVSGITRSSNALLTIVNDILEITKIESGALLLEAASVDLRELIEFTVYSYSSAAANRCIELVVNIDPNLPTAVLGDSTRIRQVLRNLVSNALKFTDAGEIEVSLEEVREEGTDTVGAPTLWAIHVRDTGIGIDEDGLTKLFQEFSQVDETTTRLYGGTGLGLFICKELCELMGGSVSVESEPGTGSTFSAFFRAPRSDGEEDVGPVRIVSSSVRWTVLVHIVNHTLRKVVGNYLRYFFSGVLEVELLFNEQVRAGEQHVSSLLAGMSNAQRLVVVANYVDCSSDMLELMTKRQSHQCVSIMLHSPSSIDPEEDTFPIDSWLYVVQKPVTLSQLCSTIERGIDEKSGMGSESSSLAVSSSSRKLSDGTMTLGQRLPSQSQMVEAAFEQAAAQPNRATVLIVDDFDLIRSLVQQLVSEMGFNTLLASNGQEAVEQVKLHYDHLSLVLMDCEMPVLDGYAATRDIRMFERQRGIPESSRLYVCAMTANAMEGDARKCFASQMSGFLAKPVRRGDLEVELLDHAQLPAERGVTNATTKKKPKA
eukprot:CAMPEP_0170735376 /NCGR_PEP_ID=MMETSP0437-20130122/3065_1 /TAXON_ID=0 /ORGANISM="Sexangularia sp." /LENGTH=848 /DNA_ID=CAMNT_0011073701 /DNA_START=87 /DNA_END=2630 /DNA_ORIENTATION=+